MINENRVKAIAATYGAELILDLGSTARIGGSIPFAFFQPVALAVHLQDVHVKGEPTQWGTSETLAAQHLGPFVEGQIAGDHRCTGLVAMTEDLKPHLGSRL
jgi:hypothetical protein